jgi:hypothetical protein
MVVVGCVNERVVMRFDIIFGGACTVAGVGRVCWGYKNVFGGMGGSLFSLPRDKFHPRISGRSQ